MTPRKTAAERAAEEAAAADQKAAETPDADETADSEPDTAAEPEASGAEPDLADDTGDAPEEQTGDADELKYDPEYTGEPEGVVHRRWPHAARGRIATQLLAAAEELNYPADVVRSTSDGFRYPENIDRYLFPSQYDGSESDGE